MKLKHKDFPMLKEAWDAYGFSEKFEAQTDIKIRPDGCYCVVARKDENGDFHAADFARPSTDSPWEVQNDGFNLFGQKDWNKLYIPEECDWFVIPGNDDFQSLS